MNIEAIAWAVALSALAYWLGRRSGRERAHRECATLYWKLGVRSISLAPPTITFRDGTTHTERDP